MLMYLYFRSYGEFRSPCARALDAGPGAIWHSHGALPGQVERQQTNSVQE